MVDFSEPVLFLIAVVFPAVLAGAKGLMDFGLAWLKTKTPFYFLIPEKELAERLDHILDKAYAYAVNKTKETNLTVKTDNKFIITALEYAKDSMPGILSYFKITDERLAEMVKARIPVSK